MKAKHPILQVLYHGAFVTGASFLYALSVNWFFVPNDIAFGGITGIALILNDLIGFPSVGVWILLMNVPLFIMGWRLLGKRFLFSSLYAMALSSILIDAIEMVYVFSPMDPLLACIYGGILLGVSFGIIFRHGASTGGVDVAARLLKLKFAYLPMGQLILILDLIIIAASALVFGGLHSALYGLVALYIQSILMDFVLYGMNKAKFAYIISDYSEEIATAITQGLSRGVTIMPGTGAYSGAPKKVLLCAFKKHQIMDLKRTVKEIDPNAFLIVSEAYEVLGAGFDEYKKNSI